MRNADCGIDEQALRIQVANEQSSLAIDEPQLIAAVRSVLEDSPYLTASISVAVVDDPTIHQINRQYLQHDYPTDILSFPLGASDTHLEGELVASADTAIHNATEYGWPAPDELRLYLIHGALHLVGYRDQSAEERAAMVAAEARHLNKLGIALPRDTSRWHPEATQGEASAT
ncbi:MAG: rRNA maturation RNase YbeY [Planctomycetes bacterium]|nr:rRNA maturation RNase YbeY [Planctomycetota bacterium]